MNDPTYFPVPNGIRTIFITAEDLAGNTNQAGGGAGDVRSMESQPVRTQKSTNRHHRCSSRLLTRYG